MTFRNYAHMPFHLDKYNVSGFLSGLVFISLGSRGLGHCDQWGRYTEWSHHKESHRARGRSQGEASPSRVRKRWRRKLLLQNPSNLPCFHLGWTAQSWRSDLGHRWWSCCWLSCWKGTFSEEKKRKKENGAVNPSLGVATVCVCASTCVCVCLCVSLCGWS